MKAWQCIRNVMVRKTRDFLRRTAGSDEVPLWCGQEAPWGSTRHSVLDLSRRDSNEGMIRYAISRIVIVRHRWQRKMLSQTEADTR